MEHGIRNTLYKNTILIPSEDVRLMFDTTINRSRDSQIITRAHIRGIRLDFSNHGRSNCRHLDVTFGNTIRGGLSYFNIEGGRSSNCRCQCSLRSTCNRFRSAIGVPLINKGIIVVVAKDSGQSDFTIIAGDGVACCHDNMDAIIHIDRIFCTQHTAAVRVGHLHHEHVCVSAVREVLVGEAVALRVQNYINTVHSQVTVSQHPLVAQSGKCRFVSVHIRTQNHVRTVAHQRVTLDGNRRVRVHIHRRVIRSRASSEDRAEHNSIFVCRRIAVNRQRAVMQRCRVRTRDRHVVPVPLECASLAFHCCRQRDLAAAAHHRLVHRQDNNLRRVHHVNRVVSVHPAARRRLHHLHSVDAVRLARIHRQRPACAARNIRPVVFASTALHRPHIHKVVSVIVAKVRREGHLAARTQSVSRCGHHHLHRVVHIHIVGFARHAAARARHLGRHRVDVGLIGCATRQHNQRVGRLEYIRVCQVCIVQSPSVLQTVHVVGNVVQVCVQRHCVVVLTCAKNRVSADLKRRLRYHPHRVIRGGRFASRGGLAHAHSIDVHHRIRGAAHIRRVVVQHAVARA